MSSLEAKPVDQVDIIAALVIYIGRVRSGRLLNASCGSRWHEWHRVMPFPGSSCIMGMKLFRMM